MELGEIIQAEKVNKKAEKEVEKGKYDDFVEQNGVCGERLGWQ